MSQSSDLLDLSITLLPPPAGSPPEILATITLRCDPRGLSHTGGLLTDPLKPQEREELRWYLEEYWKWPYEGFAQRGQQVEALLPQVGKRLYDAIFSSRLQARVCSGSSLMRSAKRIRPIPENDGPRLIRTGMWLAVKEDWLVPSTRGAFKQHRQVVLF